MHAPSHHMARPVGVASCPAGPMRRPAPPACTRPAALRAYTTEGPMCFMLWLAAGGRWCQPAQRAAALVVPRQRQLQCGSAAAAGIDHHAQGVMRAKHSCATAPAAAAKHTGTLRTSSPRPPRHCALPHRSIHPWPCIRSCGPSNWLAHAACADSPHTAATTTCNASPQHELALMYGRACSAAPNRINNIPAR